MKLRKSIIQSYAACPKMCKDRWILHKEFVTPEVANMGQDFHSFAKDFFIHLSWDELQELLTLEDVSQYLKEHHLEEIENAVPAVQEMISNFIGFEAKHFLRVRDLGSEYFFPLETELPIDTHPNDPNTGFCTRGVDRIDLLQNGMICPMEYKCTEHWGSPWHKTRVRRELAFYCVLLNFMPKYKGRAGYISAYNPVVDNFWFEQLSNRTLTSLYAWIGKINEAIKTDNFPAKFSGMCMYCSDPSDCLEKMPDSLKMEITGELT